MKQEAYGLSTMSSSQLKKVRCFISSQDNRIIPMKDEMMRLFLLRESTVFIAIKNN